VHLVALAGRAGVPLPLRRFDELSRTTPLLANVRPSGKHLMEDFYYAGGVPAVLRELLPMLDGGARAVNGKTLRENVADAPCHDPDIIRPLSLPLQPEGGTVILTGNLCPGGAVLKQSAASPHLMVHRGRAVGMDFMKTWVASATNPGNVKGRLSDAIRGADVFIGLSVPRVLTVRDVKSMARDRIVFAMANPVPEIQPEEAERHVRVMATGRSDYPNQINNVLCFPGFFRGLLDSRARLVNDDMKIAAAHAIAACVAKGELGPEYIIPSVFNKKVAPAVAREVAKAAQKTGVARRRRRPDAGVWA